MVSTLKIIFNRLIRNRILQHVFFWALSFLILMNMLKVSVEVKRIDLIYAAIFHLPILMVVYLNLRLLFPLLLEKGRYFLYAVSLVALVTLGSVFYLALFDQWIDYFFEGYYFIAYYGFWDISVYFIVYLFTSSLLRLARGWFRLQELESEKNKAELKALRSQINPHFLFNSLNSLYSLSRKNSPEVSDKIVQLSDLLRHLIYDSEQDFIPLEKEVEMVRNYIELQNLRSQPSQQIKLEVAGDLTGKKMAPMMILPFVENSFKHGLKGGAEEAFVNIAIDVSDARFNMLVENSRAQKPASHEREGGIGIENIRKRLALIYPQKHSLEISGSKGIFKVNLQIELE